MIAMLKARFKIQSVTDVTVLSENTSTRSQKSYIKGFKIYPSHPSQEIKKIGVNSSDNKCLMPCDGL